MAQGTGRRSRLAAALGLARGAPLLAAEFDAPSVATLDAEMRADLDALAASSVDVTLLAIAG